MVESGEVAATERSEGGVERWRGIAATEHSAGGVTRWRGGSKGAQYRRGSEMER
jgi:hypothetical protein